MGLEMRSWAETAALCGSERQEGEEREGKNKVFPFGLGELVSGPPGGTTGVWPKSHSLS